MAISKTEIEAADTVDEHDNKTDINDAWLANVAVPHINNDNSNVLGPLSISSLRMARLRSWSDPIKRPHPLPKEPDDLPEEPDYVPEELEALLEELEYFHDFEEPEDLAYLEYLEELDYLEYLKNPEDLPEDPDYLKSLEDPEILLEQPFYIVDQLDNYLHYPEEPEYSDHLEYFEEPEYPEYLPEEPDYILEQLEYFHDFEEPEDLAYFEYQKYIENLDYAAYLEEPEDLPEEPEDIEYLKYREDLEELPEEPAYLLEELGYLLEELDYPPEEPEYPLVAQSPINLPSSIHYKTNVSLNTSNLTNNTPISSSLTNPAPPLVQQVNDTTWLALQEQSLTQLKSTEEGPTQVKSQPESSSTPQISPARTLKVFLSYSHADKKMQVKLEKFLHDLKRQRSISSWHDGEIGAGQDWAKEIDTHLSEADIVLLLVSQDFIASDYCYNIEMMRSLERHRKGEALVIPIILKPAHWEVTPLHELQALPTEGKPITQWSNRDAAFLDVAKGIKKVVDRLTANNAS